MVTLLYLDKRLLQHESHSLQRTIHAGEPLQPIAHTVEQSGYGYLIVVIEQIETALAISNNFCAVSQTAMLLLYFGKLLFTEGEFVQLLPAGLLGMPGRR